MKRILLLAIYILLCFPFFSQTSYELSKEEQNQILNEAENWIDDMPEGMQDRLSDAVLHSMRGFFSDIYGVRELSNSWTIDSTAVSTVEIPAANDIPLLRLYESKHLDVNSKTPLLIYFHGGGWTIGSTNSVNYYCYLLASSGKVRVVSVDYPLSPETQYSEILRKCINAINFVKDNPNKFGTTKSLISLGGDGAGANLALNSYSFLTKNHSSPHSSFDNDIRSFILYYPLIGDAISQETKMRREYGRGFGLDGRLLDSFYLAVGTSQTIEVGKNPIEYDNLAKLELVDAYPPVLLIEAGRDIIIEQEKELERRLGGNVTPVLFEGAIHGFITDGHQKTALKKAVELSLAFLTE